jgi:hypothetical protein
MTNWTQFVQHNGFTMRPEVFEEIDDIAVLVLSTKARRAKS